jgi:hypothetical protein
LTVSPRIDPCSIRGWARDDRGLMSRPVNLADPLYRSWNSSLPQCAKHGTTRGLSNLVDEHTAAAS